MCCFCVKAQLANTAVNLLNADPDTLIEKSVFYTVRNIILSGNKKTKSYIVEREYQIVAGNKYSLYDLKKKLRRTKEQIINSALFVTADVDTVDIGNNEVDVKVEVKERWYIFPLPYFSLIDRNINVWLRDYKASLERVNIGATFKHYNFSGRNDKLNIAVIGGYSQLLSLSYSQPYTDKQLKQGFNASISYSRNRELFYKTEANKQKFIRYDDFSKQLLRVSAAYSYRNLSSTFRFAAGIGFGKDKIDDKILAINPNFFANGKNSNTFFDISTSAAFLHADYIPYPLRGWYATTFVAQRFAKDLGYLSFGGRYLQAVPISKKLNYTFQASATVKLQHDSSFYNSRLLGYGDYMRGFEYYIMDGSAGGIIKNTLRYKVLDFRVKNLVKNKNYNNIPVKVFVKSYADIGYAYMKNKGSNFLNNRLLRSGGFGVDIATIYDIILKLEYSFNQIGQSGFYIHTQIDF
jgi:outer membrane protein assembly factor BamA